MTCLHCENLTVGYEGTGVAGGITFSVNGGDYLCVVGENGAGKSTLIKTLLGLQKPLAGKITRSFAANDVGYLPQQTAVQKDFPATVEEIVLSGCQNRTGFFPFYRAREKQRARHNMERLEILPLAPRPYRELSGGQQQRVLLARALCAARQLLILDEPVAGLDPAVTEDLYGFVRRFNREGMTVIMITHDMSAIRYASHILSVGKTPFFGTKDDFLRTERGKRLAHAAEAAGADDD